MCGGRLFEVRGVRLEAALWKVEVEVKVERGKEMLEVRGLRQKERLRLRLRLSEEGL
jgi:hypothetical protein